jgi:hypothetical protein
MTICDKAVDQPAGLRLGCRGSELPLETRYSYRCVNAAFTQSDAGIVSIDNIAVLMRTDVGGSAPLPR